MDMFRELVEYHLWATVALIDYFLAQPEPLLGEIVPGTERTILNTLGHIVGTEQAYLAELTGETLEGQIQRGEVPELGDLRARFVAQRRWWNHILQHLPTLDATAGNGAEPPALLLLQAIRHAEEHRSQVCLTLGMLGRTPPALDGWTYWGATHPQA